MASIRACVSSILTRNYLKNVHCKWCSTSAQKLPTDVKGTFTKWEKSSEEYKWVERLLPSEIIPEPPKHDKYPTPSGWIPQLEKCKELPYYVKRTRFHGLPLYLEERDGGVRKITVVRYVQGDIWTMESDLKEYLESRTGRKMYTAVDEVTGKLRVRGVFLEEVKDFLLDKGL